MKDKKILWIIGIIFLIIFMNQNDKKQLNTADCNKCGEGILERCTESVCRSLGDCIPLKHVGGAYYTCEPITNPEFCKSPIGTGCNLPYNLPGMDDSWASPYCITGWCMDKSGSGGICENAPLNREPNEACKDKVGFCISFFDNYLHKYTGSCQMSTIVGIGVIVLMFMFMMMAMK